MSGAVRHALKWSDQAWHSIAGMVGHSEIRLGKARIRQARRSMARFGEMWWGVAGHGLTRQARSDKVR